ncbi:efflux RND transporter permease subunit, partial [Sedimenticola sp.]|uniref:efflux RND transporter permease subunit n=1 Tax=Sedimenticola sp. TaxID=1940285 RepID=UPI00258F9F76
DKLLLDGTTQAVTIAVAKKPGTNAVDISNAVIQRFDQLKGTFIPSDVKATVTRNYGETADTKAKQLISKLIFATASVVLLVLLTLGWREALIVGAAVVVTLAITLFASWAWGFTLNRVSLFALIFSIGILVDDAIVVVENIHRHLTMGSRNLLQAIPAAVDEVGGPTILATFTVIAALLPMAFVTGLMGPYMSPIPINASLGMLISLAVAFIFTPWLTRKALGHMAGQDHVQTDAGSANPLMRRIFQRVMPPFLAGGRGRAMRWLLLLSVLILIAGSLALVVNQSVVLKMLPFDNKSEFQVMLDMPEGTSLEKTAQVLDSMGRYLGGVPEVTDYQVYAGTSAPISFNGLVRQYYLRKGAHLGDIQVNLVDKKQRERKSHEVALAVRAPLQEIARRFDGNAKIVELPPGPPVQSPLVAEVYGIDYTGQIQQAKALRGLFETTPDIIDVDDSVEFPSEKIILQVDRAKAARLGIAQSEITHTLGMLLTGEDVSYLHGENLKYAVPIRVEYHPGDKTDLTQLLTLPLRGAGNHWIPLSEIVTPLQSQRAHAIYHKDLLPVVYVTGDMAGTADSPLYGLFAISDRLKAADGLEQWFLSQPENPYEYSLKWDGEWQVTYETFRDMGIAYSVGLLLIYLLVVAQFRSYLVPLVIMAPIPLTLIGILPGHALLDRQFTATSMIGMIALAGIIVRNSILLVDFINQQVREGMALAEAVVLSAVVRAKPIILTALAAMAGAFFILDDPIFSGLAISLIFGLLVSTLLTLVVIPVVYYAAMQNRIGQITGSP